MKHSYSSPNIFLEAPKSNDPPSTHELQVVETMRHFSTTRIAELEQDNEKVAFEMSSARAQQDALNIKLESLEDRKMKNMAAIQGHISNIEAYDTIRAPIRRVPLDILQEIAWHAVPDHPSLAINQAPVSLSHVCRTWRCAVLAMPRVWTTLYIPLVPTGSRRYSRSAKGINSFFERSKSLPLSLTIAFGDEPEPAFIAIFFIAIERLLPRVQILVISAGSVFTPLRSFHGPYNWEHLRSLTFISTNGGYHSFTRAEEEHHVGEVFQNAHHLRELIVDNDFATFNAAVKLLPWDQLQTLTLCECLNSDVWISLMKRCPNLTSGRFIMKDSSSPSPVPHRHQHLQELFITFDNRPETPTHLFNQIYFPNLQTLRLGQIAHDTPAPIPASYLQFHTLHTLSLLGFWTYPIADLKALLWQTNTLISLELDILTDFDDLFEALTPVRGSIQYLPNLTSLAVEIYPSDLVNQDIILTMLHGRCNQTSGCACLENLVLAIPGDQRLREDMLGVFTARQSELKDLSWEIVNKLPSSLHWYHFSTLEHSLWTYPGKGEDS